MTTRITVRDFCAQHSACGPGRDWALTQPVTTMRELWRMDIKPQWRVWIATRPGVLSDRDLRLFAVWCACCTPLGNGKKTASLLRDQRSRKALIVATRYALGIATKRELVIAHRAADLAARAADLAARTADAADAAASAASAAASAAAYAAASAAAYAARTAARKAQADHLLTLLPEFPL